MDDLNDGIVEVVVDGETHEMKPTVNAIRRISRGCKGLLPALQALQNVDVDALALVVVAGIGVTGRPAREIEEQVQRRPLDYLTPASEFLSGILDDGSDDGEGEPGEA